ncbi:MAG: aminoglycoside 3'-phosphotransferase/choline kinase family protein [Chloroflexota bacterium]
MSILPLIQSDEAYVQVYEETGIWLPAMKAICQRHGLDASQLVRTDLGSHIVFRTGDIIIKLFFHLWPEDYEAEQATLSHLQGLPTPRIVAQGWLEEWPYLLITAVSGTPALHLWPSLTLAQKSDVVTQLGQLMHTLHSHPPLPVLKNDWEKFIGEQIAKGAERHSKDPAWQGWVAARLSAFEQPPFTPVLLSADITEDHLLLMEENGCYRISGFIDFGDATMGHPYYDFIAPLSFYTFGTPMLTKQLFDAYGLALTPEVKEQITTYCLLHQFATLNDFLARHPVVDGQEFQRALWGG